MHQNVHPTVSENASSPIALLILFSKSLSIIFTNQFRF